MLDTRHIPLALIVIVAAGLSWSLGSSEPQEAHSSGTILEAAHSSASEIAQTSVLEDVSELDTCRVPVHSHALDTQPIESPAGNAAHVLAGGWLRISEPPANEPDLQVYEAATKADLREELEQLSFDDIVAEVKARQYDGLDAIYTEQQMMRRRGEFDIFSTEGIQGEWGEELLPLHYHGSLWRAWDLSNGTAEVVRLSPVDHDALYREKYAIDILVQLRAGQHNLPQESERDAALRTIAVLKAIGHSPTQETLRTAGLLD